MAKRLPKKWFKSAPPVGEAAMAPSRAHLARVKSRLKAQRQAVARAAAQYKESSEALEKHLNGARNYEEWARLEIFHRDQTLTKKDETIDALNRRLSHKDVVIKELNDRIDWFVSQAAIQNQRLGL